MRVAEDVIGGKKKLETDLKAELKGLCKLTLEIERESKLNGILNI